MITIQKYVRAQSLEEAWQLNQSKRNRIVGGMLWLRLGRGSIGTAIDLCDLGLNTIEETEDAFSIGAMTTLRQLEQHEGLNACCGGQKRRAGHRGRSVPEHGHHRRQSLGPVRLFRCAHRVSRHG